MPRSKTRTATQPTPSIASQPGSQSQVQLGNNAGEAFDFAAAEASSDTDDPLTDPRTQNTGKMAGDIATLFRLVTLPNGEQSRVCTLCG